MIGWAAATGHVSASKALLLFPIIFLWTPPHFWALALYRSRDYERAGVPMMPVVAGQASHAHADPDLFSRCWRALGVAPAFIGLGGPAYLAVVGVARRRVPCPVAGVVYRRREGDADDAGRAQLVRLFDPLSVRAVRGAAGRSIWPAGLMQEISAGRTESCSTAGGEAAPARRARWRSRWRLGAAGRCCSIVVTIVRLGGNVGNRPF